MMRVHLIEAGIGAGPPIVFIHGIGATSATWSAVMAELSASHHVVAFDLLGHGGSPVPDDPAEYTRDNALRDLDDVLAEVALRSDGTSSAAVLVGHSLGGYLSLAYAATRPGAVRGVVVTNTGPGFRDPEKREQWNERSRRNAHRFGVPVQAATLNLQQDSVVMDRLAEIATPTLVLAGSLDRPEFTASGHYLERKMPNARFAAVEGGEHAMHESTHAAEVAALIAEFVRTLG